MLLLQTGELEREIVKGRGSHVGAKFEGNLFVNTYNSITKDLEQIKFSLPQFKWLIPGLVC